MAKVYSFSKQSFAQSSLPAEVILKISWKYFQIMSNEDRENHCVENEWTLAKCGG